MSINLTPSVNNNPTPDEAFFYAQAYSQTDGSSASTTDPTSVVDPTSSDGTDSSVTYLQQILDGEKKLQEQIEKDLRIMRGESADSSSDDDSNSSSLTQDPSTTTQTSTTPSKAAYRGLKNVGLYI